MLESGAVYAILGGKFQPAGFERYGAAMYSAKRKAEDFEKHHSGAMDRVTRATKSMAVGVGGAAVAGVGLLAIETFKAVKAAAAFESSMRNVNTIAKLSEKQLDAVGKKVLAMAGRTGQAPKVLAAGLYDIVSSGFKANDALVILEASSKAATAGLTDTATSTKAVVAVLNSYHLGADQAGKVSDQLFQVVNRGVITFEELSRQIGDVLPFASSLGVGLDQLGGSIATITKGGVAAAPAMTQIKGIFNQLLSPSDALSKAIKKTGSASAESLLKTKGFQGTLEALVGTTDGSKAAVQALFPNVEALGGVLRLTGDNAKGARDDLASMADVTGTTKAAFAEQSKSFEVSAQKFSAAWEAAKIQVGQAVLPILTAKLGEWSKALSTAAEDGTLDRMAQNVARFAQTAVNALEELARVAPGALRSMSKGLDGFLGLITTIDEGILAMLRGWNEAPLSPDVDTSRLEAGINRINKFRESLRDKPAKVQVVTETGEAERALGLIKGTKLEPKVMKILASDTSARQKLAAFAAIGIPPHVAKVLADVSSALNGITSVQGAMNRLQTYKRLTVELHTIVTGGSIGAITPKPQKGKASGSGPDGGPALIGEGAGPEWVVDPAAGSAWRTAGAMIADLSPTAYVIPTEHAYRGRALGLLAGVARDLGVAGYKKGKKPKKAVLGVPVPESQRDWNSLKVPDRIAEGGMPFTDVETEYQSQRERYQTARKNVTTHRSQAAAAKHRLDRVPKGKTHARERSNARDAVDREEKQLRDAQSAMDRIRPQFQLAEKLWTAAKATDDKSKDLETQINLSAGRMEDAKRDKNIGAYASARGDHRKNTAALIKVLQRALALANPKSAYARGLREQLQRLGGDAAVQGRTPTDDGAGFGGELGDPALAGFDGEIDTSGQETEQDRIDQTGMTDAERARLADLDRDIALAALDKPLDNDIAAAGAKAGFLEQILGLATGERHASSVVVAELATSLKQARDNVDSLKGIGTNDNPDLQAQLDQERERTRIATEEARISAGALATFAGSGDIGTGGPNAFQAARGGPNITIQTLHPGDPATLRAVGDAATGGIGLQPFRSASVERLGI